MALKRAHSYEDISRITFPTIAVDPMWHAHLGEPQLGNSSWLVYGGSGDGKTTYVLQAVKMLCQNNNRVHYNTSEEGMKKSFQMALKRNQMKGISGFTYQKEGIAELSLRLAKRGAPKIVVIDSVQYFFRGMQSKTYFEFIQKFPNTTFIWISGADGRLPKGKVADDIYYDSDIVVHVKDFEAVMIKNRFEAYDSRIIWHQGYELRQSRLVTKG